MIKPNTPIAFNQISLSSELSSKEVLDGLVDIDVDEDDELDNVEQDDSEGVDDVVNVVPKAINSADPLDSEQDSDKVAEAAVGVEVEQVDEATPSPEVEQSEAAFPKGEALESDGDDPEVDEDDFFDEEDEDEEEAIPAVRSLTSLARLMRNEGYKLSVFNIKDTLIRFLEMFNERKVAKSILDEESSTFYEIHAPYIPGGNMYKFLAAIGFKPMHPTDLNENYHKDMRYDVAMSNGSIAINVFGGLQQHAPIEETVIRNLFDWEKKRFGFSDGTSLSSSRDNSVSKVVGANSDTKIAFGLMIAAVQSLEANKPSLSAAFFKQAVNSKGIDSAMEMMSGSIYEEQPRFVTIDDMPPNDELKKQEPLAEGEEPYSPDELDGLTDLERTALLRNNIVASLGDD